MICNDCNKESRLIMFNTFKYNYCDTCKKEVKLDNSQLAFYKTKLEDLRSRNRTNVIILDSREELEAIKDVELDTWHHIWISSGIGAFVAYFSKNGWISEDDMVSYIKQHEELPSS